MTLALTPVLLVYNRSANSRLWMIGRLTGELCGQSMEVCLVQWMPLRDQATLAASDLQEAYEKDLWGYLTIVLECRFLFLLSDVVFSCLLLALLYLKCF